jgi:hypothetical protein
MNRQKKIQDRQKAMFSDSDSDSPKATTPFGANLDLADFNKSFMHETALNNKQLL